jgi:hypothetical protein
LVDARKEDAACSTLPSEEAQDPNRKQSPVARVESIPADEDGVRAKHVSGDEL